jgi:hypothetical protein
LYFYLNIFKAYDLFILEEELKKLKKPREKIINQRQNFIKGGFVLY